MASRLSVCLFTRDEAANLPRVLASVEGLADEVVAADSGSIDGTIRIAREHGVRLVPHAWAESFADARNAALEAATGGWILWLNPDEEVPAESRAAIRALVDSDANGDVFGYLLRLHSIPRAERPDQFSEENDLRLFRKVPGLRYEGRVHPGFPTSLGERIVKDGMHVDASEIVVLHHAYLSTATPAKLRWATRMLQKELEDNPESLHALVEYGRTLLMLGDPAGHDAMAKAAARVVAASDEPGPPSPDAGKVLEYILSTPPEASKAGISVEEAAMLALRWFPDGPPLLWAFSERLFRAGRFEPAAGLLARLLHLGDTQSYDRAYGFDPRIVGPWALLNLGQCRRALGRLDEARPCFERLREDPEFRAQAESLLADLDPRAGRNP